LSRTVAFELSFLSALPQTSSVPQDLEAPSFSTFLNASQDTQQSEPSYTRLDDHLFTVKTTAKPSRSVVASEGQQEKESSSAKPYSQEQDKDLPLYTPPLLMVPHSVKATLIQHLPQTLQALVKEVIVAIRHKQDAAPRYEFSFPDLHLNITLIKEGDTIRIAINGDDKKSVTQDLLQDKRAHQLLLALQEELADYTIVLDVNDKPITHFQQQDQSSQDDQDTEDEEDEEDSDELEQI